MEGVLSQIDADCDDFGVRGMCSCCREEASKLRSVGVVHAIDMAYRHGVTLDFSRPGKPTENAFIEAFNCRFRAECLNAHWFLSSCRCARKDGGLAQILQ